MKPETGKQFMMRLKNVLMFSKEGIKKKKSADQVEHCERKKNSTYLRINYYKDG